MTTTIGLITDEAGFERAFGLMSLLRPHLSREDFLAAVPRLMETTGYRLVGLEYSGQLVALAGVRMAEGKWGQVHLGLCASPKRKRCQ